VSGERRFRALKLLQQRGELDGDFAVPVESAPVYLWLVAFVATIGNCRAETK
jgi:hypothetical protein